MCYNYIENMKEDIMAWMEDNREQLEGMDRDQLEEYLNDTLWEEDSVTGNASGSYTFNACKAEENLLGNRELLLDALGEFGGSYERALESAEYSDVTIRCYLLGQAVHEVLEEMPEETEDNEEMHTAA